MNKDYEELYHYIKTLKIIDTHEHLSSKEEDREKDTDVLKEYLNHYFSRDLISAGLPRNDYDRIIETEIPIGKKWELVEPYWEICRHTGYGRSLDAAAKDLYGIDRIDGSNIEELNDRFLQSLNPGHFKLVLKEKCGIETSLLDVNTLEKGYDKKVDTTIHCDREFFTPVYRMSNIILPSLQSHIMDTQRQSGIRITSFQRYLEATEVLIDKAYKLGAVAIKNHLAYLRILKYERVTSSLAEEQFNNIFNTSHYQDRLINPVYTGRDFQDYMFHYILDIANGKNLIIQIHTGIQEGSGNILSNSNPELLSNLFLQYPDVNFDIFHIGYPYEDELAVLAKNFPNVYIDMCWAHIVSPNASIRALLEFIDTVPLNKVSAFGGDYRFIDGVYGHLKIARQNVAKALSIKVEEGLFDIEKAKETAKMLFYDNPKEIFKLD